VITPAQELELTRTFDEIVGLIGTVKTECDYTISHLSSFVNNSLYLGGALSKALYSAQSSIGHSINTTRDNLIGEAPCGSGDITSRFGSINTAVGVSVASIAPSFVAVDNTTKIALSKVESLTGKMLNIQADYDLVLGDINRAKSLNPIDVMREVALIEALSSWKLLVSKAQKTLST